MDIDAIIQTITDYPYIGAAAVFLLCGLGLPIPEEIVLLASGFVCAKFPDKAQLLPMMGWCATAIMVGDMIPFLLGRIFGVRLLKLRWLRYFITKQRLATFDHWFRRRGDLVIVISRFMPGLRVVAFFTAGAMKMRMTRFLFLDGLGIVLMVPLMTWIGFRSAGFIEEAFQTVQKVERGLLWGGIGLALVLAAWIWWWRRRRGQRQQKALKEAFVQPRKPVQGPPTFPGGPLPDELHAPDDQEQAEQELAETIELPPLDPPEAPATEAESPEPTADDDGAGTDDSAPPAKP
jgi:membrane protein DedA with SNARE-associated domain